MSPYILDFDRPVTHLSDVFSWLYETCKKGIEDTGKNVVISFEGSNLLTASEVYALFPPPIDVAHPTLPEEDSEPDQTL